MIVFDLCCNTGHCFEGWFRSSEDFQSQSERGLLMCPECHSAAVSKAPMAPAVSAKSNQEKLRPTSAEPAAQPADTTHSVSVANSSEGKSNAQTPVANTPLPKEVIKAVKQLAEVQAKALKDSKWVGSDFAEKSRAMHYGEEKVVPIHGAATPEQAQDLTDEGIAIAPLPFPIAPPEDLN